MDPGIFYFFCVPHINNIWYNILRKPDCQRTLIELMSEKESFPLCSEFLLYVILMPCDFVWSRVYNFKGELPPQYFPVLLSAASLVIFFLWNSQGIWVVNEEGLPVSTSPTSSVLKWKAEKRQEGPEENVSSQPHPRPHYRKDDSMNSAQGNNLPYRTF